MLGVSNGIYCCKKLLTHFSLVDSKRNYFQIGTTTVQIEPKGSSIKITVFINKNDKLEYEFTKDKGSIVIGRKSTNDIRINSTLLSKEHCSINFKDDHWEINDGHKGKFSTNGTWIMMKSEFELLGNFTYIKIGGDIIKITICP